MAKGSEIRLCKLTGLRMYLLKAFPGIIETGDKEDFVTGELHDYSEALTEEQWEDFLSEMDLIESTANGLFKRGSIDTTYGKVVIYLLDDIPYLNSIKRVYARKAQKIPILTDWSFMDPNVAWRIRDYLSEGYEDVTVRKKEQKDQKEEALEAKR